MCILPHSGYVGVFSVWNKSCSRNFNNNRARQGNSLVILYINYVDYHSPYEYIYMHRNVFEL